MTLQQSRYTAVVTSYNAYNSIEKCLKSIVNQTCAPIEIIMVDDCSTDNTVEVANSVDFQGISFILIQNANNMGQSYSRNLATKLANSQIVIFFDDDDQALGNRAAVHLNLHAQGCDFSYASSQKIYSLEYKIKNINSDNLNSTVDVKCALMYLFSGKQIPEFGVFYVPASTLAVRKDAFLLLGGFDENFRRLEDVELFLRAISREFLISWTSEITVLRYDSSGPDKGRGIDSRFESILLDKYVDYFRGREFKSLKALIEIRRMYFAKDFSQLPKFFFIYPVSFCVLLSKMPQLCRRVHHDLLRKFSR